MRWKLFSHSLFQYTYNTPIIIILQYSSFHIQKRNKQIICKYNIIEQNMQGSGQILHEAVEKTKVKQYLILKQLGSGASSIVYLAINTENKKQVAIKVIPKQYLNLDKKLMELVKTQIYILKTCNNENVVKCYDVCQSKLSIFIVMQFCNGLDMQEYVTNKKYLSEDHAVWYLKQILNGFKGLHQIGVMHRDFKLANLLIHDKVCKIADLGFAKQMKQQDLTQTILGTQITMAPEVLQNKPYGINADIWSLGVVFYQMLTGQYPYKGTNRSDLLKNIKIQSKNQDFSHLRISPLAKDFIQGCLTENPTERITWVDIYNHGLLNKKTVQLTYGISNTSEIFYSNQQFYRRQTLDESQDSLIILRNSARKNLIIEEFQQIKLKSVECDAIYRNSLEHEQAAKLMISYSINYGAYLNQLCYPLKFLASPPQKIQKNVQQACTLYLIVKKANMQIRQFLHVLEKRINIFKIELMWQQFLKCSIYTQIINTVKSTFSRSQLLYWKLVQDLKQMIKNGWAIDQRLRKQLMEQNVKCEEFSITLQQFLGNYLKEMQAVLEGYESQNGYDLIDFCEALLYYADSRVLLFYHVDKIGNKKKLTPQRFDWSRSKRMPFKQAKADLLSKFKITLSC